MLTSLSREFRLPAPGSSTSFVDYLLRRVFHLMQSRCLFFPSQEASTAGIRLSLTLSVKILLGSVPKGTSSKYTAHSRTLPHEG
jgi:hypothetical protein